MRIGCLTGPISSYLKSPARDGQALFADYPEAMRNTVEIAARCNFELVDPGNIFPNFDVPDGFTIDSYFEQVVREGFESAAALTSNELEKAGKAAPPGRGVLASGWIRKSR